MQSAYSDQIVSVRIFYASKMTHQQPFHSDRGGQYIRIIEHAVYVRTAYSANSTSYIHKTASSVQLDIPYLLPTASCRMRGGASVPD